MALVLKKLYHGYFWLFHEIPDPRYNNFILFSSPVIPLFIGLTYLYIIYVIGPKLMMHRKPFNVINPIRVYNTLQVILNGYVVYYSSREVYLMDKSCAVVDYTDTSPRAMTVVHIARVFYTLKIIDLMDTIFFILRKSYRQISFLHVYHHTMMLWGIWIGVKYVGGGEGAWIPALNGVVHCVMYTYYLLATIDDRWKNIKYKKHLTQLQLVQFAAFLVIYGRLLFKPDCSFSKALSFIFLVQNLFMLILFGDFYVKTYMSNKKIK